MEVHDVADGKVESAWKGLYRVGGIFALTAGILFRRNVASEIGLFISRKAPIDVTEWFELLQNQRFLGLAYLHVFDLVNYALLIVIFLALYFALKNSGKGLMITALVFGLIGIGIYLGSNSAFSMLGLSGQYAAAGSGEEKTVLLAAGRGVLAGSRFTNPGAYPGAGGFISLLLIAIAGMTISVVIMRSRVLGRAAGLFGVLANGFDLAYCTVFIVLPMIDGELLSVLFIPAAGAFFMVWHILIGAGLLRLGRK